MNELHVVLGAGPLGTRLSELLKENGLAARLYSVTGNPAYDMPGTRPAHIDGSSLEAVRHACAKASVIYLCLNAHYVDWEKLFPPIQDNALEAAAGAGARLISADPVYVYGKTSGTITEDLPYTQKRPAIGRLRGEMARKLMAAHSAGKVRAAIGRYTDFYGPGCLNSSFGSTLGQRAFYPALKGGSVSVLGNIRLAHTYGYLEDAARGLMTLGTADSALGQAWHLPNPPSISSRRLVEMIFRAAGRPPRIFGSLFSGYFMRIGGLFSPDVRNVAEILYTWEQPFIVDHAKFNRAFGAGVTPHEEAVAATLDWYLSNPVRGAKHP